jgi:hypothetical protein
MALLRIAAGPLVIAHLSPFLRMAGNGVIYSDHFYQPFASWYPELPRGLYEALLWAIVGAAVLLSIGLLYRAAAWVTALGVAYNVFLSQTHFHHNRGFLIILLVGLAVIPAGRTLSLDAWLARRRGTPLPRVGSSVLALWVWRFEIAVVYLASGLSKLIDPDWLGGVVTRMRVEQYPALAGRIPEWLHDLLLSDTFHSWVAPVIVLTELAIGAGLLVHRTRLAAVWLAIGFHLGIEIGAEVQTFSWAALAALVVWITPSSEDRLLVVPSQSWMRLIAALDWTARFEIEVGPGWVLRDRLRPDGSVVVRSGGAARWFTLTRLPLTFWFAAPALLFGWTASDSEAELVTAPPGPGSG